MPHVRHDTVKGPVVNVGHAAVEGPAANITYAHIHITGPGLGNTENIIIENAKFSLSTRKSHMRGSCITQDSGMPKSFIGKYRK